MEATSGLECRNDMWEMDKMGSPGVQKIAFAALAVLVALAGVSVLSGGGL